MANGDIAFLAVIGIPILFGIGCAMASTVAREGEPKGVFITRAVLWPLVLVAIIVRNIGQAMRAGKETP